MKYEIGIKFDQMLLKELDITFSRMRIKWGLN